jgi:hypothetical protein
MTFPPALQEAVHQYGQACANAATSDRPNKFRRDIEDARVKLDAEIAKIARYGEMRLQSSLRDGNFRVMPEGFPTQAVSFTARAGPLDSDVSPADRVLVVMGVDDALGLAVDLIVFATRTNRAVATMFDHQRVIAKAVERITSRFRKLWED